MIRGPAVVFFVLMMSALSPLSTLVSAGATGQDATSIPADQVIQPADLVRVLQASTTEKPVILQVGSHVLFAQAHIVGSEYAGPAAQDAGLRTLRKRVEQLPRSHAIVIYCGCCPWTKCPNIRPAYQALVEMGFTQIKTLYLKDNFGADWVSHGYTTAKGE
jgi:thiosulfate/3-mercaptopyruvate sulfurtransferase